jgi:uncharacterized protein
MKNLTIILENAAAYYDGPSVVGYILMKAGETTSNLNLLYYSMAFIRFTMNTEQLTWYNAD